jgi:hypothetical protein
VGACGVARQAAQLRIPRFGHVREARFARTTAPMSGLRKVKLIVSAISIRVPLRNVRRMPPAALVSRTVPTPSAAATRTGSALVTAS